MTPPTDAPMSTQHNFPAELGRCNREFDQRLRRVSRHMNVRRWRVLKLLLALAILASAVYGVMEGGDPTFLIGVGILAAGGLAGLEMAELLETYQQGKQAQNQDSSNSDS